MTDILRPRLLVLGGGPGGYVAAIRAGQLGIDTVLVESGRLGGTCLARGCIPSKALIHAAGQFATMCRAAEDGNPIGIRLPQKPELDFAQTIAWKDSIVQRLDQGVAGLLRRAHVRVLHGHAIFADAKTCIVDGDTRITAENVVLAAGSIAVELPGLPFGGRVLSSTEALSLPTLPQRIAVVGAGYLGLELGTAFRKLGCSVTVIEAGDRILPHYDADLARPVQTWLERAGVTLHLGARAGALTDDALAIERADGGTERVPADVVLVTVGRRANLQGWGLDRMGIDLRDGFVAVDDQCRTSMRGVWAIGDLVGEPLLAHKASAQGEMVAEIIAGHRRRFDPAVIPAVCFTDPEIVSVGLSPAQAAAQGIDTTIGSFPFKASGRAMTLDDEIGFVRIVARRDTGHVIGVQAVGGQVSELSGEFAHAIEMASVLEDLAATIHAHPTLSEAVREAASVALGRAIHI
jgi:dihydrolipoamide dehydrogenase